MLALVLVILGYGVVLAAALCVIAALTRGPGEPMDSTDGRPE